MWHASDKEVSLCLCKICLNTKFLYDVLLTKGKKDGDECYDSVSNFLMACSISWCKNCNNMKPAHLQCSSSNELVSVD